MGKRAARLDGCFHALAHPVRRRMLERLARGPATVGALSGPFRVAAPTISKHLRVLEDAGLVSRRRVGRERRVTLRPAPLRGAASWIARYRRVWGDRLDALEALVDELEDERGGSG